MLCTGDKKSKPSWNDMEELKYLICAIDSCECPKSALTPPSCSVILPPRIEEVLCEPRPRRPPCAPLPRCYPITPGPCCPRPLPPPMSAMTPQPIPPPSKPRCCDRNPLPCVIQHR